MNFVSFCVPWGLGNIAFAIILHSFTLTLFGFGIILGGLCVAIEWDIEMNNLRVELNELKGDENQNE